MRVGVVNRCCTGLVDVSLDEPAAVEEIDSHLPPLINDHLRQRLAPGFDRTAVLIRPEVGDRRLDLAQ
jgi:hypothetical protein